MQYMNKATLRTSIDLDREIWRELKMYCAMEGVKMAVVLRKIIAEFLKQERRRLKIK